MWYVNDNRGAGGALSVGNLGVASLVLRCFGQVGLGHGAMSGRLLAVMVRIGAAVVG
ncbi:hypothetical protein O7635_01710 [Asanoa sp. WMMD1127]|uniref:hypothetical protein n=1 Tax=Asanoa sp. WMMD1127 TaxID=3016107 RepID=UPI00241741F8|nr:hypothetical protein [Asanoa sp. WMMD1127]MDG4820567.1 hypothetical protein [Asanoa sp. WMMD1127]